MSANRAVTVLRSPSRFSDDDISATRIGASFDFFADIAPVAAWRYRIFCRTRAPGVSAVLHAGQTNSSFAPHCSQNEASAGLSVRQSGQRIAVYDDSSSSSAFASFRSAVSKPSLNQP